HFLISHFCFYPIIKLVSPYKVRNSNSYSNTPTNNWYKCSSSSNSENGGSGSSTIIVSIRNIATHLVTRGNYTANYQDFSSKTCIIEYFRCGININDGGSNCDSFIHFVN